MDSDLPEPLIIRDCALLAIATGRLAQNLKELRDQILAIHPDSLFYHFWGGLLHSRFEEREYNNDFAAWARHGLHDKVLAERLSAVEPSAHADLEEVRRELAEIIEQRLDEREVLAWAQPDQQFEFIRSQTVVFLTRKRFQRPEELAGFIGELSIGSIFYHFVDARRRNPDRLDDFRVWLQQFGERYVRLAQGLAGIDPYFTSLTDLRARLVEAFGAGLAEPAGG